MICFGRKRFIQFLVMQVEKQEIHDFGFPFNENIIHLLLILLIVKKKVRCSKHVI